MSEKITFPLKDSSSYNRKLIDGLLDIKLTLVIKKITSNFIKKSELKKIVDDAKEKMDKIVAIEIDKVFDEYFIPMNQEQYNDSYNNSGQDRGKAYVKSDGHNKTRSSEANIDSGTSSARAA